MADFSTFVESLPTILATLGVTSLAISLFERWQQNKENKKERFRQMVLTPEFFEYLSTFWTRQNLLEAFKTVQEGDKAKVSVRGHMIEIHDMARLNEEMSKVTDQLVAADEGLRRSGVFFLLPDSVRHEINRHARFVQLISEAKEPQQITRALIDGHRRNLFDIQDLLRKEAGL